MLITLDEAKAYLKIEGTEDDAVLSDCVSAANELTLNILRCQESDLEEIPKSVKQAALFCTVSLYENREGGNIKAVLDIMKGMLFAYRKDAW